MNAGNFSASLKPRYWLFPRQGCYSRMLQHVLGRFKQSIFLRYWKHSLKRSSIVSHSFSCFTKPRRISLCSEAAFPFNADKFFSATHLPMFLQIFWPFLYSLSTSHDFFKLILDKPRTFLILAASLGSSTDHIFFHRIRRPFSMPQLTYM